MAESEEQAHTGLMIAIPLFLALNALLAVIGSRMMSRMSHETSEDVLTAHYLGGRSFGPWLTLGTMFASLFSGFTVVGMPNEAYNLGFYCLRWVNAMVIFPFIFAATSMRLRKASLVRNHQTSADFITDMFRSQILRYTVITSQLISQFVWMTSNVLSIKNAFNGAFNLDPDSPWLTIAMVAFILISEWFGGLTAVTLMDTVQWGIMIFGTFSVMGVIKHHYSGWTALDPMTYHRPEYFQTLTKKQQWIWWQLGFLEAGVPFYPVTIQRIYAAKSLQAVRLGAWATFLGTVIKALIPGQWNFLPLVHHDIGPWMTMLGAVFVGTMGVEIIGQSCASAEDPKSCNNPSSPFASILQELMLLGGFPEVASVILYTSALAAIMSTTDSISQIITSDIIYPMRPNATPGQVAWIGRFVSFAVASVSLIVGLSWKGSITLLFSIGLPIAMQIVPVFLIGLYSQYHPHPWSLGIPALACMIVAIFVQAYWPPTSALHPAIFVTLLNLGLITIFEGIRLLRNGNIRSALDSFLSMFEKTVSKEDADTLLHTDSDKEEPFAGRPKWDKPKIERFGDHPLTPKLLNGMMKGVNEPMRNYLYVLFMCFAITMTTPLAPELQPPLNEDGTFVALPSTVNGLPWWVFKSIILIFVAFLVTIPMIMSIPDEYPFDEDAMLRSGVDADVIELDPEEKGQRTKYDESCRATSRRELVRAQTDCIQKVNAEARRHAQSLATKNGGASDARAELTRLVSKRVNFSEDNEELQNDPGQGDEQEAAEGEEHAKESEDDFVDNELARSVQ
ncbi:hypothetical protein ACHAWF_011103 [Thalassiosira exigua]